jgi:PLP dependent protein
MNELRKIIEQNLARVRDEIAAAAKRCGRRPDEIKLVATTKYVNADVARLLLDAGHAILGESRPQDLWQKAGTLSDRIVEWHLIGHLQRNKIRRTLPLVTLIHSVDSERLLEAISAEAASIGKTVNVLLEVNISGDESKHGFGPGDLEAVLEKADQLPSVKIQGLMGMASLEGGAAQAARNFDALRNLRDRLQAIAPPDVSLSELSMGMSSDFAEAIAAGATLVRIGSALFEGIEA